MALLLNQIYKFIDRENYKHASLLENQGQVITRQCYLPNFM